MSPPLDSILLSATAENIGEQVGKGTAKRTHAVGHFTVPCGSGFEFIEQNSKLVLDLDI